MQELALRHSEVYPRRLERGRRQVMVAIAIDVACRVACLRFRKSALAPLGTHSRSSAPMLRYTDGALSIRGGMSGGGCISHGSSHASISAQSLSEALASSSGCRGIAQKNRMPCTRSLN